MTFDQTALLAQFIPEARDLLDEAGRSLLLLERLPGADSDNAAMNALFRAVHTLKGTSSLFEIGPLTRVVHAAEDVLCAVQAGELVLAAELADVLLNGLDQVGAWIEALADTGVLPEAAEVASAASVLRLRAPLARQGKATLGSVPGGMAAAVEALPDWVQGLSESDRARCRPRLGEEGQGQLAVSYEPDVNCFFRGEDPLALMSQILGLRLLQFETVEDWPALADLDPFRCNLRLRGIVAGALAGEVEQLFRYVPEQVAITELPLGWDQQPAADTAFAGGARPVAVADPIVRAVLAGQRRLLLAAGPPELWPGRAEAAARALRGALLHSRTVLEPGFDAAHDGTLADRLAAALHEALQSGEPEPLLGFLDGWNAAPAVDAGPTMGATLAPSVAAAPSAVSAAQASEARAGTVATLRVEPAKIDALMNLIGELVVAKNGLAYLARQAEQGAWSVRELAREIKDRQALVNRIAEEMQGAVMAVRMLPVEHVFQRFPRLVRDIARRLAKRVELVVEGGETEADKNVIEALADPLIHMVRNSLDHGIETPAERLAAGKPEHGTIRLQALHANDQVIIRLIDDGRGIDPAVVRRKAVEKRLVDASRAAAMSDEEAVMLVFAAGFSTAAEVSDLSGRGVGMDVVRSAVEKAGGRVALSSRKGQGTSVELTLPLSMAVSRIMTVACGDRLFGVPMALVAETVRIPRAALHRFRDREAFVLRDSIVPVIRLVHLLDLPEPDDSDDAAILVVRLGGERLGLVVDAFRDGMEVIVKPLEGVLAGLRGVAGTTLLGDGRVLLILNLSELVA